MERLTQALTKTVVYTKGKYEDTTPAEMTTDDVRTVLRKLAEYEDIGTPAELKQLKENRGFTSIELAEMATALKELQAYREQELIDTPDKEARNFAEMLREYCRIHKSCKRCVFHEEERGCDLLDKVPCEWTLKK